MDKTTSNKAAELKNSDKKYPKKYIKGDFLLKKHSINSKKTLYNPRKEI